MSSPAEKRYPNTKCFPTFCHIHRFLPCVALTTMRAGFLSKRFSHTQYIHRGLSPVQKFWFLNELVTSCQKISNIHHIQRASPVWWVFWWAMRRSCRLKVFGRKHSHHIYRVSPLCVFSDAIKVWFPASFPTFITFKVSLSLCVVLCVQQSSFSCRRLSDIQQFDPKFESSNAEGHYHAWGNYPKQNCWHLAVKKSSFVE